MRPVLLVAALLLPAPALAKPGILGYWKLRIATRYCHGFTNCHDHDGEAQTWRFKHTAHGYVASWRDAATGDVDRVPIHPRKRGWAGHTTWKAGYACANGIPSHGLTRVSLRLRVIRGYMVVYRNYVTHARACGGGPTSTSRSGYELAGRRLFG